MIIPIDICASNRLMKVSFVVFEPIAASEVFEVLEATSSLLFVDTLDEEEEVAIDDDEKNPEEIMKESLSEVSKYLRMRGG